MRTFSLSIYRDGIAGQQHILRSTGSKLAEIDTEVLPVIGVQARAATTVIANIKVKGISFINVSSAVLDGGIICGRHA